jgi:hypothetical protein
LTLPSIPTIVAPPIKIPDIPAFPSPPTPPSLPHCPGDA